MVRTVLPCSLLVGVLASLVAGAGPAHACSIAVPVDPPTEKEHVASYDLAIYGRVVSVRETDGQDNYEAKVRIHRVYRGRAGSAVRVSYTTQPSACGTTLKVGRRIGRLLDRPAGPYSISAGNRISLRELNRATGGNFHRPHRHR